MTLLFTASCEQESHFEGEINFDVEVLNDESGKMKSLAPTSYNFKIKNNRIIFTTEGGLSSTLFGGMIFDGLKDEGYLLMKSSQLAYKMAKGEDSKMAQKAAEVKNEVKAFPDTMVHLGYVCKKYEVLSIENEKETLNELWVAEALDVQFPKSLLENSPDMFLGSFKGFPLVIITKSHSGREIRVEASEIIKGDISSENFEIPDNYKVTEDDPSEMINMFRQFLK